MQSVLANIQALAPFVLFFWCWLLLRTKYKPQKYFNSILLMISCFFLCLFIAGLFGDYMGYALLALFLLCMLALLFVPFMLIVNGIVMLQKERFAFSHILSLLLGIIIAIGETLTVFFVLGTVDYPIFNKIDRYAFVIASPIFYVSCLILSFVLYSVFIQIVPHRSQFQFIVIHGCGLIDGERVTRLLSDRIDRAIQIYNRCAQAPIIIPSGGRGPDEKLSEAEAMSRYLIAHGIPSEHIILEDRSSTTMENLINSKKIIDNLGGKRRTALISSNYHVYRCLLYADEIGLKCTGIGSHVALYYWPCALLREFVAVFKRKKFLIFSVLGYLLFMFPYSFFMFYA